MISNEELHRRIDELERELQRVKDEKAKIEEEKSRIEKEKSRIEKEFEEFRAAHSVTVDHLRRAMHIKPERKRSGKHLGAQNGHQGYTRRIPQRIDYIKSLVPKRCPHCNEKLRGKTIRERTRTITDIRLITPATTTQYRLGGLWCHKCRRIVEEPVRSALPGARFGLNLMLLIMYLRLALRIPGNKVREYLQNRHGLSISEGEIAHILRQLTKTFGPQYKTLQKLVRLARVKHTDSTSWRINGKNYWAWVFIATGIVLYSISKRNNHKTPLRVLGCARKGDILCVDRHSAYRTLARKTGYKLQLCWSHLLEDSREQADYCKDGRFVHTHLKAIFALAKSLNHRGTPEQVEQLQGMIIELGNRKFESTKVRRFVNTIATRDLEDLFRFVTDEAIDPTNNLSERELRAIVIIRKISNGSKSRLGANTTATLLSLIQTFRLRRENPLQGLQRLLNLSQS
jgi:hypothetical protein